MGRELQVSAKVYAALPLHPLILQSSTFYRIIHSAELKHLCYSVTSPGGDGGQIMIRQEPFAEGRLLTPEEVAEIEARKQAAIRAAQGTPGTCTQHLRLSIDFHITIAGTPPEEDGLNPPDPVYHARQARLLAAVKNHPLVLTRWMHELIVSQIHSHGWYDWDNMLMEGEITFKDILAPAIATLAEDDQAFFAEYDQAGSYFEDGIDLFQASFTIKEEPAVIREQGEEA
jgi:hypothetical protein